jgi:N-terminal domain of anti-restriction factor ArdC
MTNHLHRERAERPKESPKVAPKTAAPKASLYEEITARIIADLEAGTFPWAQPWGASPGNAALGLPRNAATGKSYSGINVLILWGRLFDRGFTSQSWLTFHQAFSLGGAVRKGEHGVSVCYADKFIPKGNRSNGAGGETSSGQGDGNGEGEAVPFLRRYIAFNVAMREPAGPLPWLRARLAGTPDRTAGRGACESDAGRYSHRRSARLLSAFGRRGPHSAAARFLRSNQLLPDPVS